MVQVVKNLPANAGDIRDMSLIPGSGRSLGVGSGNPLQYSCLGNSMERGAWQAVVYGTSKSQIQLNNTAQHNKNMAYFSNWNIYLIVVYSNYIILIAIFSLIIVYPNYIIEIFSIIVIFWDIFFVYGIFFNCRYFL